ncbi:MAG: hypothetical protein PUG60_03625, partial [Lachnospiraceae bacterium]|nr:hypothetical protein [Lachnospiraceae bacterium]
RSPALTLGQRETLRNQWFPALFLFIEVKIGGHRNRADELAVYDNIKKLTINIKNFLTKRLRAVILLT